MRISRSESIPPRGANDGAARPDLALLIWGFPMVFPDRYLALDFETTGLNTKTCGIVEIAVAFVDDDEIAADWSTLCNPGIEVDDGAFEAHKITPEEIAAAPSERDAIEALIMMWLDAPECVVVAYNGDRFDRVLLATRAAFYGIELPPIRWIDPLPVARVALTLPSYTMGNVATFYGVRGSATLHRAAADVAVLVGVVSGLRRTLAAADAAPPSGPATAAPRALRLVDPVAEVELAPVALVKIGADAAPHVRAALSALEVVAGNVAKWCAQAAALPCDTDAEEIVVVDAIGTFRALIRDAEKARKKWTDDLNTQKRAIDGAWREYAIGPAEAAIKDLEDARRPLALARARAADDRRRAQIAQAEADALAEAARRSQAEAEAVAAAELAAVIAGDAVGAEVAAAAALEVVADSNALADSIFDELVAHAEAAPPPKVVGNKATVTDRLVWRCRVVAPRVVPAVFCSPDLAKILAAVEAAGGDIEIAGVEIWNEVETSTRSRR